MTRAELSEPVAYAPPRWPQGYGSCIRQLDHRSIFEVQTGVQYTPLYAHPDPRIAELERLLRDALGCIYYSRRAQGQEELQIEREIRAALKGGEA